MNIVLIGLGKVGKHIADLLSNEGHKIIVVDIDKDAVEEISTNFDVLGVTGNAVSVSVLNEAKVNEADLLIAVTDTDEINMLTCLFAQKLNKNIKTIARIRNPIYSMQAKYLRSELGITYTINPEVVAAREIVRLLKYPDVVQVESFSKGRVELVSFNVEQNEKLVNKSIEEISKQIGNQTLFVAIERDEEVIIPNGQTIIKEKDVVSVVFRTSDSHEFFSKINIDTRGARNVMVIGASMISYHLARLLEKSKIGLTIIEKNKSRCEELSKLLADANIIYGDATDKNLLTEEGIKDVDAFVSLTNMDEENVMLSLYAKTICDGQVITKIDHVNYDTLLSSMDLYPIVSPKEVIANEIVAFIRGLENAQGNNVNTLYRILNGKAEVLSFAIKKDSPIINKPLSVIKRIDNTIICSIIRDGNALTPGGDDVIKLNDIVLVATSHLGLKSIEDIFKE